MLTMMNQKRDSESANSKDVERIAPKEVKEIVDFIKDAERNLEFQKSLVSSIENKIEFAFNNEIASEKIKKNIRMNRR